jgi:hypothetical protein
MPTNAYRPNPLNENNKTIHEQRMILIFNEWNRRYAENPNSFDSNLNQDGTPCQSYGENCVAFLDKIAKYLDSKGILPRP